MQNKDNIRNDWKFEEILDLFNLPFNDLMFEAQTIHRKFFNPNEIQMSTLLSIKTGSCPEDCKYCPQSAHYNTDIEKQKLMKPEEILKQANQAKEKGATRFCMGIAWRNIHDRDLEKVGDIIKEVKKTGLELCLTAGMITKSQAEHLKNQGLDFYNHNIDSSEEYYKEIITTRSYEERLQTLSNIREADLKTCCGGIIGMGESLNDRVNMLLTLANLPTHPESVPINLLMRMKGTPLYEVEKIDDFDFIRTIAVARIMMPKSWVRLSAGRTQMNDQMQALCFLAGANSIFNGNKLLTTPNPDQDKDNILLSKLGIKYTELGAA